MADESVSATTIIDAPADVIFGVLADPAKHAAIDGTGGVRDPLDSQPLTTVVQMFRVAMYHENHPDGDYQMANRVQVFDPPSAISWEPGHSPTTAALASAVGSGVNDLAPAGPDTTRVTLTYDWSAVPDSLREHIGFPPFRPEHLGNSLAHLAELAAS